MDLGVLDGILTRQLDDFTALMRETQSHVRRSGWASRRALAGLPDFVSACQFGPSACGERSGDVDVAVVMRRHPGHEEVGAPLAALQNAQERDYVDIVTPNNVRSLHAERTAGR